MSVRHAHLAAGFLLIVLTTQNAGRTAIVYEFKDGDILDDDGAGATATFPADDQTAVVASITTTSVTNTDGTLGAELNENKGSLGVNSNGTPSGEVGSAFDENESWTFTWDADTTLDFVDFDALSGTETFLIQSPGWQGKEFAIQSGRNLTFDQTQGEFSFGNDGTDTFDLTDIVSGDSLLISAATPYTFSSGSGTKTEIGQFTFSASSASAVPEPGTATSLLTVCGLAIAARFHRKRH